MFKRFLLCFVFVGLVAQSSLVAMQSGVSNDRPTPQNLQLLAEARANCVEGISAALARGAYIDFQGENRESALHVAVKARALDAVVVLVRKGINVFLNDSTGQSALQEAMSLHHYDAFFLIVREVKVNRCYDFPLSPICSCDIRLFDAVFRGDISALLSHRHLCNTPIPSSGITPIMLACQIGNVDAIRYLVSLSAHYNIIQLLCLAVQFGHMDVVTYLLSLVRDVKMVANSSMGEPPLNTALHCGRYHIAAYLHKKGVPLDIYSEMYLSNNEDAKIAFDSALVACEV